MQVTALKIQVDKKMIEVGLIEGSNGLQIGMNKCGTPTLDHSGQDVTTQHTPAGLCGADEVRPSAVL